MTDIVTMDELLKKEKEETNSWSLLGVNEADENCLHSIEDMLGLVRKVGFLPLFRSAVKGFSVEERTVSSGWWTGDEACDPWSWRVLASREPDILYGKFFNGKAGFISKEWFPYFANYRRNGYDFDALYEDGKTTIRQKKIMDLFTEERKELFTFDMKKLAGFGKDMEKGFEGTLSALQMKMYLCVGDFRQKRNKKGEEYGWTIAVYTLPETLLGYDCVTSAYKESPETSYDRLKSQLLRLCKNSPEADVEKLLQP